MILRTGMLLSIPLLLLAHVVQAKTDGTFDAAFKTCIAADMSAEARFLRLEQEGWVLLQDNRRSRELNILYSFFFERLVQLRTSWDGSSETLRAKFAERATRPDGYFKAQSDSYGGKFSAAQVMKSKHGALVWLEHPDLNGHIVVGAPDVTSPDTAFTCAFYLVKMPEAIEIIENFPNDAATPFRNGGIFRTTWDIQTPKGETVSVVVDFSPLSDIPHYNDFLKFIEAENRLDGIITTSAGPIPPR